MTEVGEGRATRRYKGRNREKEGRKENEGRKEGRNVGERTENIAKAFTTAATVPAISEQNILSLAVITLTVCVIYMAVF